MKFVLALILSLNSMLVLAHDEGHGPAIKDESLNGGKVSAVIKAEDVKKGRKAGMLYKAELVHDPRKLNVKVFIYDQNMKPISLKELSKEINAVQIERGKEQPFTLTLDKSGKFYHGLRPKNKRVPFNIDVKIKKGEQTLFSAFDGLD